jgi:hypothetical protein
MLTLQEARALASRSTPDGGASKPGGLAIATIAVFALAACSSAVNGGGGQGLPPASGVVGYAPTDGASKGLRPDASGKVVLTTSSVGLYQTGSSSAKTVSVTERNYFGTFTESSTCKNIVTVSPASGKGPTLKVTLIGVKAGSCAIKFIDAKKNQATLAVTDTTASVALSGTSMSPGSKSVAVTLQLVNGHVPAKSVTTTVITNLAACSSQCSVAAPQTPAGTDVFGFTIFDGTGGQGNKLATGTTTTAIVLAKANTIAASLAKIPVYLAFGTIPSATAGTPLNAPLPLTIADADHNAISGTYTTPISVSDSDTSSIVQGSSINVSGSANARSVQLTKSSQTLNLVYGGLAISPVTLSANIAGSVGVTAQFAPSVGNINYAGPKDGNKPEIDLYNPLSGSAGYSGNFTLSQAGWSNAPYDKSFAYALGGAANNCSSYVITPPSGSSASSGFTVSVAASPQPGFCTLTATGALGNTTMIVTLSYTSASIGASGKRKP